MCGATPSGRIPTKLGICVRLTDVIKRAQFHCYNLRGFGAVRCSSFHVALDVAIGNTLLGATAPQMIEGHKLLNFIKRCTGTLSTSLTIAN